MLPDRETKGTAMLLLDKHSMGIGDRFARQGKAQLRAFERAKEQGVHVAPVWNKSHREHTIIGTAPADVRREADEATKALGWGRAYFVDADHIGPGNVDLFLEASDFFTLDVADFIGKSPDENALADFVDRQSRFLRRLSIPGISQAFNIDRGLIEAAGRRYLLAVQEAGALYRRIEAAKGEGNFVTEISMDETDVPQTPLEMLFILAAAAQEGIPVQTIAPRFTGRFNKGVDYVGDISRFVAEFEADLAIIALAVEEFGLPANLKLSIQSGSDKFSLYGPVREAIRKFDAGLHVKTAGTTWLEELIGLALAGGDGLELAKEVYAKALERFDELAGPYASVIDINPESLPNPETVQSWDGEAYAAALRHDWSCQQYNPHFRQLLHVGYKIAAEMGQGFLDALDRHGEVVAHNVEKNIYERHLEPLFIG
jgi:hypothetical protein